MKNLRIVFMGTPEFAVATLGSLLMNGYNVVGVVTVPDKASGRGQLITKSAVKVYAEENKLHPLMQPSNLKDPEFIGKLKSLNADIFIVVAFRMLPQEVWKIPRLGTINLHASLLPDYRGAAPINHAIINGETMTGVTTFLIDEKIDTGNILLQEEVHISPSENAGDLHDKLMKDGARLMIKTISGLAENKLHPRPQANLTEKGVSPKLAPKIQSNDLIINWNDDAVKIHNFIRGLSPYPTARSWFRNETSTVLFKIFESRPETEEHSYKPGSIISDGKTYIRISCRSGYLSILNLQLEGKKRMNTMEFLRGFRISNFTIAVN
jgi:methionyl-tRNA formyltransferase